jgi:hypothetical protein
MPTQQLADFEGELAGMTPCYALTAKEMESNPICTTCNYRPSLELQAMPAKQVLDKADNRLDKLLQSWTGNLISNLDDPIIKKNLALLKDSQRKLVEAFIKSKQVPDSISRDFINAVNEALSGLEKVTMKMEELRDSLLKGGAPMTIEEARKRFENYLEGKYHGKDPDKIRINVE